MNFTDDEHELISKYYYIPSELERMIILKLTYGPEYINQMAYESSMPFD